MAESFLKSFDPKLQVFSAGVTPAKKVNSFAIRVMQEVGISMVGNQPQSANQFLDKSFDYVITVCDDARETCPIFTGQVMNRIHFSFEDPDKLYGTEEEALEMFRDVRELIRKRFLDFYNQELLP